MSKFLKPLGRQFHGDSSIGYDLNAMPMKAKALTELEQEWLGMTVSTPTGVGQVWCITCYNEIIVIEFDELIMANRPTTYPKPEWGDLTKLCSVRNQAAQPALFPPIEES